MCPFGSNFKDSTNMIPGLVADGLMGSIPNDPSMAETATVSTCCYLYKSNGTDYKFLAGFTSASGAQICVGADYTVPGIVSLLDPLRDGGGNESNCNDGNGGSGHICAWSEYTQGALNW